MAVSMGKPSTEVAVEEKEDVQQTFNIVQDKQELVSKYKDSPEVDKLTTEIEVYNTQSIVNFGAGVADEVAKASDTVLNSMSMSQLNDTGKTLGALNKIMKQFDIEEFKEEPKGIKKIFGGAKKQLDKIITKYDSMGKEIDKIYVQLKQYEAEIESSNKHLAEMFDANVEQYHKLELYILAGEQGVGEIQNALDQAQAKADGGDSDAQFDVQNLTQAKALLEQRVQDLRIAEQVAMQAVPMIKTTEYSNYNLVRKINSAFIVTLPVFKQSIAQAMLLKRQQVQADAMKALDDKTNELLLKNAQNSAAQTANIARMTSQSSIKVETIEESWKAIMQGIEETKRIQSEAETKRNEDKLKLEQLKQDFENVYGKNN
jgi:uncharacterized protein YaaN involved in tellurite resistance